MKAFRKQLLIALTLLFFSCKTDPKVMLPYIDGYWEIQEVTLKDGSKKEYTFSNTIDYLEVSDSLKGFRKKLKPNLLGTFETSNDKEYILVSIENDSLHLNYTTPYATWKETVLKANDSELLIVNANKDMYLYKRYESIDINPEDFNK